jgi:hypothetical protein
MRFGGSGSNWHFQRTVAALSDTGEPPHFGRCAASADSIAAAIVSSPRGPG